MFNVLQNRRGFGTRPAVRPPDRTADLPTALAEALKAMRLVSSGERPQARRLAWPTADKRKAVLHEVRCSAGTAWVKQALPGIDGGLDANERTRSEVQWLRFAREVIGDS